MKTKYTVEIRMANPGPVQYLIDSTDHDDFMSAFYHAQRCCERKHKDHFVQIVPVEFDGGSHETKVIPIGFIHARRK